MGLSLDPGVKLVEVDVLKPDLLEAALRPDEGSGEKVAAVICATGYVGFNPTGRRRRETRGVTGRLGRDERGSMRDGMVRHSFTVCSFVGGGGGLWYNR